MPTSEAAINVAADDARRVAVRCAQLDGHDGTYLERVRDARSAIRRSAEDADAEHRLVLLPELWPVGFFHFDNYAASAESLDGPTVTMVRDEARAAGVWVLGGSFVEAGTSGLHNTMFLVGPDGALVLTYRKIHLFGYDSRESELLTPGGRAGVADTAFGRMGVMTCYDLRFPELARDLVSQGAEAVLIVSAWPAARIEHWRTLLRARAIENQVWVVAVNTAGTDAAVALGGYSAIFGPDGTEAAEAGEHACDLTGTIDVSATLRARAAMPFVSDNRYSVTLPS